MPNDDLDEGPSIKHVPFIEQKLGLHVG